MEDVVTIKKAYFDALLRRAELHTPPGQSLPYESGGAAEVAISKEHYDCLARCAQEYCSLRKALLENGVSLEMLDTLVFSADDEENQKIAPHHSSGDWPVAKVSSDMLPMEASMPPMGFNMPVSPRARSGLAKPSAPGFGFVDSPPSSSSSKERQLRISDRTSRFLVPDQSAVQDSQRTLLLSNLAPRTSHKDISQVVRGGQLAEIWLRNDRCAQVSFVNAASAREFLDFVKRNDLYINNKRIEASWSDRQFKIIQHVSIKIAEGATRNIIIVNGARKGLSESRIRDDMDHIHNLVIVDVQIRHNGDVLVCTNSIHNALYARTCMRSRLPYKLTRIEYAADECAAPLPFIHRPKYTTSASPPKSRNPMANLFGILNSEGTEDGSDDGTVGAGGVTVMDTNASTDSSSRADSSD